MKEYSDILQPVSIDEGYLQLPIVEGQNVLQHVQNMQNRIWNELQLPCSIGIAPNKFLAKMASDMKSQWVLQYSESVMFQQYCGR